MGVVQVEQEANDGPLHTSTEVCPLFTIRTATILFRSGVVRTRATASPSRWKNFNFESTIPASKTAVSSPFLRSIAGRQEVGIHEVPAYNGTAIPW